MLTSYEIAVTHEDGRSFLVCYTARKSRSGLASAVRGDARWDALVKITGVTGWQYHRRAADGVYGNGWTIRFTGRTKRDAQTLDRELPFILDAVKAA